MTDTRAPRFSHLICRCVLNGEVIRNLRAVKPHEASAMPVILRKQIWLMPQYWYLHLANLMTRGTIAFSAAIVIESLVISIAIAEFMVGPLGFSAESALSRRSHTEMLVFGLAVAPIIETLFFQALPVAIVRRFDLRGSIRWLLIIAPFAFVHFDNGLVPGVSAGIVGGVYLGVCYWICRQRSYWFAFYVTAATHCVRNALAFAVFF